jgi:hypothetical protein
MEFRLDAYLKDCNRAPEALGLKKSAIEIYVYGLTIMKNLTTLWYIVNKRKNELLHKQIRNILHAPILWVPKSNIPGKCIFDLPITNSPNQFLSCGLKQKGY